MGWWRKGHGSNWVECQFARRSVQSESGPLAPGVPTGVQAAGSITVCGQRSAAHHVSARIYTDVSIEGKDGRVE